ncbi:peripheral-type benzodiazepine receptor-associated protein 1-like isoform X3 [Dreissena polymorpha]|uniref:peripheral-type benzodiazepine receptor-associated protein 1-like isoform X3 n=1 Tax=Dreissena polymorpha TaxID=45954 RepID=UPI002264FF29|nr:peripheral-type benzodiazepine receptor-associated protein 1-like isoform X3 [Dreissena polymorpha]
MESTRRRERRKEDGSSHQRHHRENNYDFDFNDISRASTPTSTFSTRSEGKKREKEHKYSIDDYKRKIARLKSELELEKAKNKKAHKEKSSELKEIRESYEVRKQVEIDELEAQMKKKIEKEKKQLEENLKNNITEEKDKELQNVLKYKEEELRELRKKYKQEKESAIKLAIVNEKRIMSEKEMEMQSEIEKVRKEKEQMEAEYKKKLAEENKKEKEFSKLKEEYDAEMRRILSDSKKLAMGNIEKLRKAEKALTEHSDENDDELDDMEFDDLLADLQLMHSQASSRAVSRCVSTTSELKFDEINAHINNLLSSPAVTPGLVGNGSVGHVTLGIEGASPLTLKSQRENKRSSSVMSEPARDLFNRKQDERDRQLQKKVAELQTQTQRLERKIALLKTENETLKRKQDDKKPLEEKIKTLKKRNAELAAIARRLEEKAKHLQQENMKKARELASTVVGPAVQQIGSAGSQQAQGQDQMKKLFARQRAKDLAEHAKQMLSKDREIEDLRGKCQELADQLSNSDFLGAENCEMFDEKEELIAIVKHAARERLSMERQLAIAKPSMDSKLVSIERFKELEETHETLKGEIVKLERAQSDTERLEIELTQKKLECERLKGDIKDEKLKSKTLEEEVSSTQEERDRLAEQVFSLQARLDHLEQVNEECSTLRLSLSEAQQECEVAKSEVSTLQLKVQNLETLVQNLEYSTEKLKQVEKDYHEALQKLHTKQRDIDSLQKVQESAREKYETAIKSLQDKISGLENQCEQQNFKQQELVEELTQLRAASVTKNNNIQSAEIQTGRSLEFAPSSTSSPNQSPRHSPVLNGTSRKSPSTPLKSSQKSPALSKTPLKSPIPDRVASHSPSKTPVAKTISPSRNSPVINNSHSFAKKTSNSKEIKPAVEAGTKKGTNLHEHSESTKSGGTDTDKGEDSGMESRGDQQVERDMSEMSVLESRLSVLAKKGPIQVYIAKYSYDPYVFSPNENPEAELPLKAGDYVLVYGEMDEDGFFDGELLDGKRGLVPSNFIQKVAEEDMEDFQTAMALAGQEEDSTAANSMAAPDLDSSAELEKPDLLEESKLKDEQGSDLDEEQTAVVNHANSAVKGRLHSGAPFPRSLQLDRQLATSILVSWSPPDNIAPDEIRSYHVFLDGDFKLLVRGNERTKALLENVESRKIHRVSVRCISSEGQSHDNQCTILVGKDRYFHMETDVIPTPFDLRVFDLTATTATVSWTPGDSRLHHAIYVNNVEVWVAKPGVFSYTLSGLNPATNNVVKIQARNLAGKADKNADKLVSSVEFTTEKGGLPDPPVNVQVEAGPQEGSVLLTWFPVTIDTEGVSKGAVVAGYTVYADGKRIKHVPGATNDHSILTKEDYGVTAPRELYVCTITKEKLESDRSEVVIMPEELIREIMGAAVATKKSSPMPKTKESPVPAGEAVAVMEPGFDLVTQVYKDQPLLLPSSNFQEPFYDSSCSELSDIPEVEEPSSPDSTNENPPMKDTLKSLVNGLSNMSHDSSDFEEIYQRNLTQEQLIESGPSSPANQVTPKKSHDQLQPIRKEKSDRLRQMDVPQIEITRESSVETDFYKKQSAKMDMPDTSKSPKLPKDQSPANDAKYSAKMDSRDGYREDPHAGKSNDTDNIAKKKSPDTKSHPNASKNSNPRQSKSNSPSRAGQHSRESPRSQSSPRERDAHKEHSPRTKHKEGLSPKVKTKTSSGTAVTDSPTGSPTGWSRSPLRYPDNVESLELSKLSSIEKNTSDLNIPESDDDSITGEINPPVDDNRIRLFVALFDYDPETMSPNVDTLDEELPFREGQIIKVYGDKDADGFYRGECAGRVGYIPCNMVSEIQVDDPELEEQLLKEVQSSEAASVGLDQHLSASEKYLKPITSNGVHSSPRSANAGSGDIVVRRMVAMYDYDPQELSPNVDAEVELSFKAGDIIICYGEMDDDGFYMAELHGQRGLVPSNFLQESGASDEELLDSVSVITPSRSGESINTSDSRKSEKSENLDHKQHHTDHQHPQQQQQSASGHREVRGSPGAELADTQPDQVTRDHQVAIDNHDIGMLRPRSLTPEELKQKKKTGGIFSRGKNIFKKLTK